MAKKTTDNKPIEIFNITLSQIDRGYKGIDEWRTAIKSAESIHNPRRKLLYDLYDEVMLDMHLSSITEKRKLKVANTTLRFFNADGKENEVISSLLETEAGENMIKDIIDSRFYGHSLLYFNNISDNHIDYALVPRRHVRTEFKHIIKEVYDDTGIDYSKSLHSRYIITAGKPKDLGLLSKAAVGVIYKKGDVADWSVFAQVFGTPFREFTYEGNDPKTKAMLEEVAKNSMSAPYVVTPVNTNMQIHDTGTKSGSSQLYKHLAEFCDDQMSKLILHNTMTTDAKGGNYKGEVHADSEKEVEKADKMFVIRILNEKFKPILENFGFNVKGGWFTYEDKEHLTMKQRLEIDEKLAQIVPIDDVYFYDTYNIPQPKNKDKVKDDDESKAKAKAKAKDEGKDKEKEKEKDKEDGKERKLASQEKSFFQAMKDFFFQLTAKNDLSDTVNDLYTHKTHACNGAEILNFADNFINIDALTSQALMAVYSGVTPPNGIDPSLWRISFQELNKSVDQGFGAVRFGDPDFDFVQELKYNNGVFSAFKNHHKTKELASLLRDEKGNLKSFSNFKKDASPFIDREYRHLKTEFNTAVRSARNASNFRKWERTRDLYPNLEYLPSRSAEPRPEHKVFYHTVAPMNDPFWASYYPPLDWNCMCGVTNSDKEVTGVPQHNIKPAPGLDNNPGITRKLFGKSHPYEAKLNKKQRIRSKGKVVGLERRKLHHWALNNLRKKQYEFNKIGAAAINRKGVNEWLNQPHKHAFYKNRLLLELDDVVKHAEFIKTAVNINPEKNPMIKAFHYFKIELRGDNSFINIAEMHDGSMQIYTITDKIK